MLAAVCVCVEVVVAVCSKVHLGVFMKLFSGSLVASGRNVLQTVRDETLTVVWAGSIAAIAASCESAWGGISSSNHWSGLHKIFLSYASTLMFSRRLSRNLNSQLIMEHAQVKCHMHTVVFPPQRQNLTGDNNNVQDNGGVKAGALLERLSPQANSSLLSDPVQCVI